MTKLKQKSLTFFKLLVFVAILPLLITNCANEDHDWSGVPDVEFSSGDGGNSSFSGSDCFDTAGDFFERFAQSQSNDKEIEDFWGCINSSLETYEEKAMGRNQTQTVEQMHEMLRILFSDLDISVEFLQELFFVKKMLVGGSEKGITRQELQQSRSNLVELGEQMKRLHPHMRVIAGLFFEDTFEMTEDQYLDAKKALLAEGPEFAKVFGKNGVVVTFTKIKSILQAVVNEYELEGAIWDDLDSFMLLVQMGRNMISYRPRAEITPDDWEPFFNDLNKAYMSYLALDQWVINGDFSKGIGLRYLKQVVEDFNQMFYNAFETRTQYGLPAKVPHEEYASFFVVLEKFVEFPFNLDYESIIPVWTLMTDKVLLPEKDPTHNGFDATNVDFIASEFKYWYAIQNWINDDSDISDIDAINEMKRALDTPWDFKVDEMGRIIVVNDSSAVYSQEVKTTLNWIRAIVRLIIRTNAEDPVRISELRGVTLDEMRSAYFDIKDILVRTDIVDPDDNTRADDILLHTDYFMTRSNGDGIISFEDLVEWTFLILQSQDGADDVWEQMTQNCPVFTHDGEPAMDINCFRQTWKVNTGDYYPNLPDMQCYLNDMADDSKDSYLTRWEELVMERPASKVDDPLTQTQAMEMYIFQHYMETFFQRFDLDRSYTISVFGELPTVVGDLTEDPYAESSKAEVKPSDSVPAYLDRSFNSERPNFIRPLACDVTVGEGIFDYTRLTVLNIFNTFK